MLFANLLFLLYFFPAALILYHLCFFSRRTQNVMLLLTSLAFYALGQTVFVLLLLFSIIWNWAAGLLIEKSGCRMGLKKTALLIATVVNIMPLLFFKQLNPLLSRFFSETNLSSFLRLGLPLGLSYFTLQAIGYTADVFRGNCRAEQNPVNVALYLSFFPQMISGPLVRYNAMREQMFQRHFSLQQISAGMCRFTIGLAKVVLVGNAMGRLSEYVFSWSAMGADFFNVPVLLAWVGLLAFILKLYHQLSGYCDMAIGLALMLEYRLPENFERPFMAGSMTEFWQRWNITLLGWFRTYLYPFLRNFSRHIANADIVLLNLFLTWFSYALWHGTNWSIMFWGALQFLFLLLEHFIGYLGGRRGSWYMRIYTIAVLVLSCVFLRAENLYVAGSFFKNLFGMNGNGFLSSTALVFLREYWLWFAVGILSCFPLIPHLRKVLKTRVPRQFFALASLVEPVLMALLLVLIFVYLSQNSPTPFEYF